MTTRRALLTLGMRAALVSAGMWRASRWLGGPDHYVEKHGHPRLRMRHMPFSIGIKERDQWVACMDQAMGETHVPEDLRIRLKASFFQTADWMRNKGV